MAVRFGFLIISLTDQFLDLSYQLGVNMQITESIFRTYDIRGIYPRR